MSPVAVGGPTSLRRRMVRRQVRARGIDHGPLLQAMSSVPREEFVPEELQERAYDDAPLPIAEGQSISKPISVALMVASLDPEPGDVVLEVGTGSGYGAAILSHMVRRVHTVERFRSLARGAARRLELLGYDNVQVHHGDGTSGWPQAAPFDGIVVTAAVTRVPQPLQRQLVFGGRLVVPVGPRRGPQELLRVRRINRLRYVTQRLATVRFPPLVPGTRS